MIQFIPLTAEHAIAITRIEGVNDTFGFTPEAAVALEEVGGVSAVVDGVPVAMAGILPRWDGVGMAWAWLGRGWRRHARAITQEVDRYLRTSHLRRIEAGVRVDYVKGHSWARRLGFKVETPVAKAWGADGADYTIYVRLQ